jgi:hypothetical protein
LIITGALEELASACSKALEISYAACSLAATSFVSFKIEKKRKEKKNDSVKRVNQLNERSISLLLYKDLKIRKKKKKRKEKTYPDVLASIMSRYFKA